MFKVNDYSSDCKTLTIEFDKHWHQVPAIVDGKNMGVGNGRYDTCCHITCDADSTLSYHGKALLNPKDQLDRVIGKKVALTKAMIESYRTVELPNGTVAKLPVYWTEFASKQLRVKIWEAFQKWVRSWKKIDKVCGTCCYWKGDRLHCFNEYSNSEGVGKLDSCELWKIRE